MPFVYQDGKFSTVPPNDLLVEWKKAPATTKETTNETISAVKKFFIFEPLSGECYLPGVG